MPLLVRNVVLDQIVLEDDCRGELEEEEVYLREYDEVRPVAQRTPDETGLGPEVVQDRACSRHTIRYQVEVWVFKRDEILEFFIHVNEVFIFMVYMLQVREKVLNEPTHACLHTAESAVNHYSHGCLIASSMISKTPLAKLSHLNLSMFL